MKIGKIGNRRQMILLGVLGGILVLALVKWGGSSAKTPVAAPPSASRQISVDGAEVGAARPRIRSGEKAVSPEDVPVLTVRDLEPARPQGGRRARGTSSISASRRLRLCRLPHRRPASAACREPELRRPDAASAADADTPSAGNPFQVHRDLRPEAIARSPSSSSRTRPSTPARETWSSTASSCVAWGMNRSTSVSWGRGPTRGASGSRHETKPELRAER